MLYNLVSQSMVSRSHMGIDMVDCNLAVGSNHIVVLITSMTLS